ncbi:BTB/POZ domain-containing protein At2g46260-like [Lotus japonicus]|uniref:BTB/POZ domain-containing protein At2g46260-like n=1 Tax=Lotus japonicus TaxID=34305 RepID=UPI00258C3408|nr:BTB/POZ domain-containing protein At2g46260-like [Lotus japonicus]
MESEWSRGGSSSDGFDFNDPPDSVVSATTISVCKKKPRQNGDETANHYDSNWTMDCSTVRLKTLHISSHILPFVYKLSSYGMSESEHTHVRIKLSGNTLNITAAPALLDVLMAADKFEVSSCMNYCRQLLRNSVPMTLDSALLYLEHLPHTDKVQSLIDATKLYLVDRYKDITKFQEEVMTLPLSGIEAILASDDLQVESENRVYDIVLMWVRKHYNELKERQEVLGTRLARLIRFPYMTCQKLETVLACDDFAHNDAFELVLEALLLKAEAQQSLTTFALNCRFVKRAYKDLYVKVVEFELPRQQCVVYLDLKRKECATLFPFSPMKTQTFYLGGQRFFIVAACGRNIKRNFPCFKLAVAMMKNYSGSFVVDCEFAVRSGRRKEFVVKKSKMHCTFTGGTIVVFNLFKVSWTEFIAENSPFFVNDVLHLKAELTIRP